MRNTMALSETESNNTIATADQLTAGKQLKGQLSSKSDVDYYKYTKSGAALLNLSFDLPTDISYIDYFSIQVLDSSGNTLSGVVVGQDGSLKASVSEAGTYFVKVAVANSSYHDSGQYGLTLTESAYTSNYESEPNGYGAYGDLVTSNQKMSGQLKSKMGDYQRSL